MNDMLFEILTSIVALAAGAAWYKEFIARRKLETDLAVEKQMRKLDEDKAKLAENKKEYDSSLNSLKHESIDGLRAKLSADTNGSILGTGNSGGDTSNGLGTKEGAD